MSGGSNSQGVKLRAQATSMRVKIDEACSSRRPGKRNLPKPESALPNAKDLQNPEQISRVQEPGTQSSI